MDLKNTYESLLADGDELPRRSPRRKSTLTRLNKEMQPLESFECAMQSTPESAGITVRHLLDRCLRLRSVLPALDRLEVEHLPDYCQWWAHRKRIHRFATILQDIQADGVLANHPLKMLSPHLANDDRPLEMVSSSCETALRHLELAQQVLSGTDIPAEDWCTLARVLLLVEYAGQVQSVADRAPLSLLAEESETAGRFADRIAQVCDQRQKCEHAQASTKGWLNKLPADDVLVALEQARRFELQSFPWVSIAWWRMRRVLNRCYDFRSHVIRPSWSRVLSGLQSEYELAEQCTQLERRVGDEFGINGDIREFVRLAAEKKRWIDCQPEWVTRFHASLVNAIQGKQVISQICRAREPIGNFVSAADRIIDEYRELSLDEIRRALGEILNALDDLLDFVQCLGELLAVPASTRAALRRLPLPVCQVEAAVADRCLATVYRNDRNLARFTQSDHQHQARRLETLYDNWLEANAAEIRHRAKCRFLQNVRRSGLPAAQLSAEQKEFKKCYSKGRRELEHEFGKSMRYKAIRDLVSGETGEVVKDLKPVWLMSPLSVSDTLPLDEDHVDVVIFDEASQVTLEDAVPALFRAPQTIVVGDQMQLPPTDFFSAKRHEDEEGLLIEEAGELVQYDLDSNSFLNHAARNLPSTMLGWHYRSRSESLIGFSNWAFYDGRLLTVPEETLPPPNRRPICATRAEDGDPGAAELLHRPISFHFMQHGVYENRRNRAEAEYIAHLIRAILKRRGKLSLGVVAFSEAQQGEIEDAIGRLGQQDPAFGNLLDAEYEREEDGQFVGLLVKNLENIQGDERDIIILSVCYGRASNGKMLMNFGPINKSGGEKRLNVAFSRAKHHMALVSSIRHTEITNDYNDGANCLRKYLQYADAVSQGDMAAAQRVLHGLSRWHAAQDDTNQASSDVLIDQLAAALEAHQFVVDRTVGQSHFRCDLGVRLKGDRKYRLGILVDGAAFYEQDDILERDMMRPRLLREFGWKVTHVLAKDWYAKPEQVMDRLLRLVCDGDETYHDANNDEVRNNRGQTHEP